MVGIKREERSVYTVKLRRRAILNVKKITVGVEQTARSQQHVQVAGARRGGTAYTAR
jgi:hypothetical protein